MEIAGAGEQQPSYDRFKELKAFEESKAGVKGIVDAGIVKIPRMFIRPLDELTEDLDHTEHENSNFEIPVIDIKSVDQNDHQRHKEVIDEVRRAAGTWGFFRLVNHGIPLTSKCVHVAIDSYYHSYSLSFGSHPRINHSQLSVILTHFYGMIAKFHSLEEHLLEDIEDEESTSDMDLDEIGYYKSET